MKELERLGKNGSLLVELAEKVQVVIPSMPVLHTRGRLKLDDELGLAQARKDSAQGQEDIESEGQL